VQCGNLRLAIVIGENDYAAALGSDGCVIRSWDNVFATVARSNGKWEKGRRVKEFSDAGNHEEILSPNGARLKTGRFARRIGPLANRKETEFRGQK
jgi:hypothetical protein